MEQAVIIYLLAVLNYAAARSLQGRLMLFFHEFALVRQNYLHRNIPYLGGVMLVLAAVGGLYLLGRLLPGFATEAYLMLLAVLTMAAAGLVDDLWGTDTSKGLRGHLMALVVRRRITSGLIKAAAGLLTGLAAAVFLSKGIGAVLINTFLIALTANFINLLDLRPGRALKMFFVGVLVLLPLSPLLLKAAPLLMLVGPALVFFPLDINGEAMLGDVGANVLGIALGIAAVMVLPPAARVPVVLILIYLHWYSERESFSQAIDNISLLRRLDRLGRI